LRALEEALLTFAGCAVVISHDRWFLDRIATHMLAFEDEAKVVWFEGNYQDYEKNRHERLGAEADQPHRLRYKKLGHTQTRRAGALLRDELAPLRPRSLPRSAPEPGADPCPGAHQPASRAARAARSYGHRSSRGRPRAAAERGESGHGGLPRAQPPGVLH